MRVETIILDCIKRKYQELNTDDDLINGICEYVKDNQIEQMLQNVNSRETREFLVESFLTPILDLPRNIIEEYFKNYKLIKGFRQFSKNIFQQAKRKYNNEQYSYDKKDEEGLISVLTKIYSNNILKNNFAVEISDILLDLDFLKTGNSKYSLRLIKWIEGK